MSDSKFKIHYFRLLKRAFYPLQDQLGEAVEARGVAPELSEEGVIVGVRACTPEAGF